MKQINIGKSGLITSEIGLGCMRMGGLSAGEAAKVIHSAYAGGIRLFDHADIYGGGRSEEVFSAGLKESGIRREDIVLQSKCGIRKGFFDFSKEHILSSVDGILSRLKTDWLDILLLHRPDTLMEPEEVAEAFNVLYRSGKVRYFGVSNQNPMQMELLGKATSQRLIVNQLQFSPVHTGMIDSGLTVNMKENASIQRDGMVLEWCRLHDVTIQPWSPFQHGMIQGVFLTNPAFSGVTEAIERLAAEKGLSASAMTLSWILRHPAHMQPVVGSMNPDRIAELCQADGSLISREEWYEIYRAAGNLLP